MIPRVRRLAAGEIDTAADVLGRAFHDDPLTCYRFPDPEQRAAVLGAHLRPGVWLAQTLGEVWCTDDLSAIACWRPPGASRPTPAQRADAGVDEALAFADPAANATLDKADAFLAARAGALQVPPDHWYLTMVGVDPRRRRQGLGTAALRPVLERAEADGEPVYLETFGPQNPAFYLRCGCPCIEHGTEPNSGFPYWLLLRPG